MVKESGSALSFSSIFGFFLLLLDATLSKNQVLSLHSFLFAVLLRRPIYSKESFEDLSLRSREEGESDVTNQRIGI
jgi:hypothetical protein